MNIRYKEDPRAWRNNVLLSLAPLLVLTALLLWRHLVSQHVGFASIILLIVLGILASLRPGWFRAYYRASTWAGFWSSQWVARVLLACLFIFVFFPAGVLLRLFGKDPLQLKRLQNSSTYWRPARPSGSLDRLF
jgi:hypothetical protein